MTVNNAAITSSAQKAKDASESERELNRAIEDLRGMANRDVNPAGATGLMKSAGASVTMQIPVEVNVILGSVEMAVGELASLRAGATIPLGRRVGEPVDVTVNGVNIARGEIILVEQDPTRFGLRITEILG